MRDDFEALRARGAPPALLAAIAASGLPGEAVCGAVVRVGWFNRFCLLFNPRARLSGSERARLDAIAALATAVAADEGGPEGARRFWNAAMPWLDGRTPAEQLRRGDIGGIEELRARINFGIPP